MALTKETLLRERYRCIADYPGRMFKIGEILHQTTYPKRWEGDKFTMIDDHPAHYPAIFQELKWWEERTNEDMPEYILNTTSKPHHTAIKIKEWTIHPDGTVNEIWASYNGKHRLMLMWGYSPITKDEYDGALEKI